TNALLRIGCKETCGVAAFTHLQKSAQWGLKCTVYPSFCGQFFPVFVNRVLGAAVFVVVATVGSEFWNRRLNLKNLKLAQLVAGLQHVAEVSVLGFSCGLGFL